MLTFFRVLLCMHYMECLEGLNKKRKESNVIPILLRIFGWLVLTLCLLQTKDQLFRLIL